MRISCPFSNRSKSGCPVRLTPFHWERGDTCGLQRLRGAGVQYDCLPPTNDIADRNLRGTDRPGAEGGGETIDCHALEASSFAESRTVCRLCVPRVTGNPAPVRIVHHHPARAHEVAARALDGEVVDGDDRVAAADLRDRGRARDALRGHRADGVALGEVAGGDPAAVACEVLARAVARVERLSSPLLINPRVTRDAEEVFRDTHAHIHVVL